MTNENNTNGLKLYPLYKIHLQISTSIVNIFKYSLFLWYTEEEADADLFSYYFQDSFSTCMFVCRINRVPFHSPQFHILDSLVLQPCPFARDVNFLDKPKPIRVGLMSITQSTCREPACLRLVWTAVAPLFGNRESAIPRIVWPTSGVVSGKGALGFLETVC